MSVLREKEVMGVGTEISGEDWREEKKRKRAQMKAMQALPYEVKVRRAEMRAREFVEKLDDMGLEAHISVGGLDSIVLLLFLRRIGINVPAISVSSLEDKSIQRIHKDLGVIRLTPGKSKVQILQEQGFPVISKKIAGRIDTLQHPTEKIRLCVMRSSPVSVGLKVIMPKTAG